MGVSVRAIAARRLRFLPARSFTIALHLIFQGRPPALRHPTTFTDLLAARNLGDPDPLIPLTADKFAVREYVAGKVGEQYLIPLVQVVDRVEQLDFDAMSEPCVIKATHGTGMIVVVRRGQAVDRAAVSATVARWLSIDFYRWGWRERSYRGLTPRVVVEKMIGDGTRPPDDYKFLMFRGEPGIVQVDQDRFGSHLCSMLSPDWREFRVEGEYAPPATTPPRPASYDEMLSVARALSEDFEFARVDLYDVDGRVYFGEITHYPGGGVVRFRPRAFDRAIGDLWRHGTPMPETLLRSSG